jgi:HK97 family phage major capsid protein
VYENEATAATDLAPTFTAPARLLVKAHTLSKYSVEIQQDYALGSLEAELAREIADAKDVLEADEFGNGAGSTHHPFGIFAYYTANFLDTATTLVIVPKDLYALAANIGPRYRGNLVWLGSPYFYALVRGIDTAGGAGLWVDNLSLGGSLGSIENNGRLGNLIGYPAFECLAPANTSMATTEKVAILANRERFVIIDRIGLNLQQMPFVSASTGLPNGEEMVYAWWRNTSVGLGLATLGAGREACIFRGK